MNHQPRSAVNKLGEGLLTCALWAMIGLIAWNLFTLLVLPCRRGPEPYPPRVSPRGLSSNPGR
jgi:hypothetical protein